MQLLRLKLEIALIAMEPVLVPLEDGEMLVNVQHVKDIQINAADMEHVIVMEVALVLVDGLEAFAIVQQLAKMDVQDTELVFVDNANVMLDINFWMIVHAKIHAHQIATTMEIVVVMVLAHVTDMLDHLVPLQIHAAIQHVLPVKKIQIAVGALITMFAKTNTSQNNHVVLKPKKHLQQHVQIPKFKLQLQVLPKIEPQQLL